MKELPANLATHPIEQRQWARRVTVRSAAFVLALTVAHVALGWSLVEAPQVENPGVDSIEALRALSDEVVELARASDPGTAQRIAAWVGLSNALIDQRVFRWGALFSVLEESLPDDVRLETIQPVATLEGVRVSLVAASPSGASLIDFVSALEDRPEFSAVYPGRQSLGLDGDLRLSLEATADPAAESAIGAGGDQLADGSHPGLERRPDPDRDPDPDPGPDPGPDPELDAGRRP